MLVPEYGFTLTEHDARRPWMVVGHEHRTVTHDDRVEFFAWARERWASPGWTVKLGSRQLTSERSKAGWVA